MADSSARDDLFLPIASLPIWRRSPLLCYGFGLIVFVLALLLRWGLDPYLPSGVPFVTFFVAVVLTAFLCGVGPGIAVLLLSIVAAWYFFLPPIRSFALDKGGATALGLYLALSAVNLAVIHAMQTALAHLRREREKSARLAEQRELLFTELQHRISNNLQVISALLAVQKSSLSDAQARQALNDASQRLVLIAQLNRKLHDPNAYVDLKEFLQELCRDISTAAGIKNPGCNVNGTDGVSLPPDKAIPLALIVAELLSNSIEHGFAGQETGRLRMDLERAGDDKIVLTVQDDGHGLPAGFDIIQAKSLGLRIVQALAQQIGARLEMFSDKGTTCRLTFAP